MDRILTTHTGSLIRPPDLLAFLGKMELGEPFDQAEYERTLRAAVDHVVRRQVEAGIDVVSDGEMGKSTWITYLYERLTGLESRMVPLESTSILPPSRDRQAFPGFYAEHDAAVRQGQPREPGRRGRRPTSSRTRRRAGGQGLGLHRAALLRRDRAAARHRQPARRARGLEVAGRVPAGGRARQRLLAAQRALRHRRGVRLRARRRDGGRVPGDRRLRLHAAGRRRRAHARVRLDPVARRLVRGLPALGRAARRRAQPRAHGPARGPGPLPRLLGQLARPARLRPAAARRRRPGPAREGGRLRDRAGQPAPRARVAHLGGRRAARGQEAHPRRGDPPHERGRASRARRRAARRGWPSSSAARTSSAAPTAASRRARSCSACTRRSSGPSSRRSRRARASRPGSCGRARAGQPPSDGQVRRRSRRSSLPVGVRGSSRARAKRICLGTL